MENKIINTIVGLGLIFIVITLSYFLINFTGYSINGQKETIKIGIITDLTGPASYWGESTRVGSELAVKELNEQGYEVELIFEDYQLDATKARNSAQKLVNIDNVDAIYTEFNPAAISVGSFTNGKELLFVYDAAVISPLEGNPYAYKTYLDYQEGCKQVSEKFKEDGIEKIGILKVNLEFGELCLAGVKEVYPDAVFESYNLGDKDFKTQILKLDNEGVEALINVGFEGDSLNTLKVIKEQDLDIRYGTVDDTITENVKENYIEELNGGYTFGFKEISSEFNKKIQDKDLATQYGAAIAYMHIKQIVKSIDSCGDDYKCVVDKMDDSSGDTTIGFNNFSDHIAKLDMAIKKY